MESSWKDSARTEPKPEGRVSKAIAAIAARAQAAEEQEEGETPGQAVRQGNEVGGLGQGLEGRSGWKRSKSPEPELGQRRSKSDIQLGSESGWRVGGEAKPGALPTCSSSWTMLRLLFSTAWMSGERPLLMSCEGAGRS